MRNVAGSWVCAVRIGLVAGCHGAKKEPGLTTAPIGGGEASGSGGSSGTGTGEAGEGGRGGRGASASAGRAGGAPLSEAGRGGAGTGSAGMAGEGVAGSDGPPTGDCFDATLLWSDNFESGDYGKWTGRGYGADWGDGCQDNAITTKTAHSPSRSQRSEISCVYNADGVHRGYGGLQFDGDTALGDFTNAGLGIDAPNGVVNTMWMRFDSDTVFENGKWVNFLTVHAGCDWGDPNDQVLTIGLEDPSGRLSAAHYWVGSGTRTFENETLALPRHAWSRITTYINYYTGVMHVWQDGVSQQHVTFTRSIRTLCHFHWGLYASADNDAIVLFEDDKSLWKLNEPWEDFSVEPYFGEEVAACE